MRNPRLFYNQRAQMQAMRRATIMTVLWLALGLAVGAAMALLFAPSPRKKTRRGLTKRFAKGWNSSQDAFEPVVKRLEKEMGGLRHTVEDRIAKMR